MRKLAFIIVLILFCAANSHSTACSNTSLGNSVSCVQSFNSGGSGTGVNPNFSGNVTANNLIVIALTTQGSTVTIATGPSMSCTTLTASTSSPIKNVGNNQTFLFYGVTSGACASITLTISGATAWTVTGHEFSGIKTTSPLDCDNTGTGNGTALATSACTSQAGSVTSAMTAGTTGQWAMIMSVFKTAAGSNVLVVAQGGGAVSSNTWTAGSGYTLLDQNNGTNHSAALEAKTVSGGFVQRRR